MVSLPSFPGSHLSTPLFRCVEGPEDESPAVTRPLPFLSAVYTAPALFPPCAFTNRLSPHASHPASLGRRGEQGTL